MTAAPSSADGRHRDALRFAPGVHGGEQGVAVAVPAQPSSSATRSRLRAGSEGSGGLAAGRLTQRS